jgi:pimeloyl-ACP methyl ester carboxylesterase
MKGLLAAALVATTALLALPPVARSGVSGFGVVSGHRIYYECTGHGSPTVILDAGSPDTSAVWRTVQPAIARHTHVCAYDRPGLGLSDPPAAGRRTARTQADELHSLLASARIAGPYVLVGHSWGGLIARLFAFRYPRSTAGVVLVDATTFPYLTPATASRLPRTRNREGVDLPGSVAASLAVTGLGSTPLVVLGSNKPPLDAKLLRAQDEEAALSSDSVDAIARRSTHYIQSPPPLGQPTVVVAATSAVVAAARAHRHLPSCRRLFAATAVLCRAP